MAYGHMIIYGDSADDCREGMAGIGREIIGDFAVGTFNVKKAFKNGPGAIVIEDHEASVIGVKGPYEVPKTEAWVKDSTEACGHVCPYFYVINVKWD